MLHLLLKLRLMLGIVSLALALTNPAYATGGGGNNATATGTGIANSNAAVSIDGSGVSLGLGGASVGAAECAEAIAFLGIFAESRTDPICRAAKTAMMFCNAGYLTGDECRRAAIAIMMQQGLNLGAPPAASAPATGTAAPAVASERVGTVNGVPVTCHLRADGTVHQITVRNAAQNADAARAFCRGAQAAPAVAAQSAAPARTNVVRRPSGPPRGAAPKVGGLDGATRTGVGCSC